MRDDGARRREYDAETRSKTRRDVYVGSDRAGHCTRVTTDLGPMWEGLARLRSHKTLSLGFFDTPEEAEDAVAEWFD